MVVPLVQNNFPKDFNYLSAHPIPVTIDWQYDTIPCGSNRIDILKIAKR